MRLALHVSQEARRDLEAVIEWYESIREGLGRDFLVAFETTIDPLRESPRRFPIAFEPWRRAISRRFPYGIYYRVLGSTIWVDAVVHLHRDPDGLRRRLDD